MDLEIAFKNEKDPTSLLYIKNVDSLEIERLKTIKRACDYTLNYFLAALRENEYIKPVLSLEYRFLSKEEVLYRMFNGISTYSDFDFLKQEPSDKEIQELLNQQINKKYKLTKAYSKAIGKDDKQR